MNLPSSDGGGASSTASSTSISLNTKTADDVSKVEVKNNSDSYTVEMKSEDSYSVEGLDGFDLNKTSISALKSDSAGVAASKGAGGRSVYLRPGQPESGSDNHL